MAADCTCGHPQSQHKSGKQGCRNCDIGCARYEPDEAAQVAETERVLTAVAEVCEDQADRARVELGQPSTAAQLDELRRGRDEAVERALELAEGLASTRQELEQFRRREERIQAEWRDLLIALGIDPDGAVPVLMAAKQVRGDLDQALARVDELAAQLEQAEQYARDLHGVVIDQAAQHCPPCGWTGREPHPHPTIPVRVLIHRTEGPA